jgi:hypothetical protein
VKTGKTKNVCQIPSQKKLSSYDCIHIIFLMDNGMEGNPAGSSNWAEKGQLLYSPQSERRHASSYLCLYCGWSSNSVVFRAA